MEKNKNIKKSSVLDQWRNRKKQARLPLNIPLRSDNQALLATSGQHRLWLLHQLNPKNPFYQYGHLYKLNGPLNVSILSQSIRLIIEKHEILRSNFTKAKEGLLLKINSKVSFQLELLDISNTSPSERENKAYSLAIEEAKKPFNLEKDLLIRASLLKISEKIHWLVLSLHHIIGDRSSLIILNTDLFKNYQTLIENREVHNSDLSIQYADYAQWKNTQKYDEKKLDYWLHQLSGELPILSLPHDFKRPKRASYRGETLKRKLSIQLSDQILSIAKRYSITPFVVFVSAFKILLFRYSSQKDILVGSPFSNRDKPELEKVLGFFNETVVLRTQISDNLTFEDLLQQVNKVTIDALAYKDIAFDELVQQLKPERYSNINPLFQAMFVYNNPHKLSAIPKALQIEEEALDLGVSKFDLTLFVNGIDDQFEIALEFALDILDSGTAKQMLRHLEVLLNSVVASPQEIVSRLPILDEAALKRTLIDCNNTTVEIPEIKTIHHLIEQKAKETPSQVAVIYEGHQLIYEELNYRANAVASHLLEAGVSPIEFVGLYTQRSLEMIIGILGILKAGAAYLPLDPDYPPGRIDFMLQDADVSLVLIQEKYRSRLAKSGLKTIDIEKASDDLKHQSPIVSKIESDHLAYIIYTSGSTGKPKGVPISHKNLIYSTTARFHYYSSLPASFLLLSSFSFDSSVAGIFWTLCSGGVLVLPPKGLEQDIQALSQLIKQHKITHTLLLPSLYQLLLEYSPDPNLKSLQTVMVAGEACPAALVSKHYSTIPDTALVNEYGPTETTVWCTAHRIVASDAYGVVPIGRPIPNVKNYVLDTKLQPVPTGVIGELYVGGPTVAGSYLNRPDLTAERLIADPFSSNPNAKLYKTGDLVRFRKNGLIEFLGRVDAQVKIRGHRIELDEIKMELMQLAGIKEVVLSVQKEKRHPHIIAYLSTTTYKDLPEIRPFLAKKLPNYMIPSVFVQLKELPKLPNGKIDLSKLPPPDKLTFRDQHQFVAPSSKIEKLLAEIWESTLGTKPIGLHDNFFEIGGDSIRSIQLIAKAQQAGLQIASTQLFEHQTIGQLAQFLETKRTASDKSDRTSVVPLNTGGTKPPLFCIHSGGAHVFFYQPLAQQLREDQAVYAIQASGLDQKEPFHSSIEEMAAYYIQEMQKIQPLGPYRLLGTCFSNAVGLEMARQLYAAGQAIDSLIFVDSGPAYLLGAAIRGERKTVQRFFKMANKKDWRGITKKFRNRWIRTKQKLFSPLENDQERNLRLTINSLNKLYNYYSWKPYPGKVIFIRSTEFANRADKNTHIDQWTKLAKGGLEVHIVPGHHTTLFSMPEVKGLADVISECLETASVNSIT